MPPQDYDTRLFATVKSTAQALVTFQTNRYSVPVTYALPLLTLKADEQSVYLYDKERLDRPACPLPSKTPAPGKSPRTAGTPGRPAPRAPILKHRDLILGMGQKAQAYLQAMAKTQLQSCPYK